MRLFILFLFPAALCFGQDTPDTPSLPEPEAAIQALDFLAGSWSGPMWGATFEAWYSTPEGGKVLSSSLLLSEGNVHFWEFEKFEIRRGNVWVQPFPKGQPAASFELVELDVEGQKATFDCPTNDFPSRIVYEKNDEGHLVITLSDPHNGTPKVEVFDLAPQGEAPADGGE